MGHTGIIGLLSPWTAVAIIGSVGAFYASARSLQDGGAVEVIAITGTAASITCIAGGILVFSRPDAAHRARHRRPGHRLRAGHRRLGAHARAARGRARHSACSPPVARLGPAVEPPARRAGAGVGSMTVDAA